MKNIFKSILNKKFAILLSGIFLAFSFFFSHYDTVLAQSTLSYVAGEIRTDIGYKTTAEVAQFETEKSVNESTSFKTEMVAKVMEEGAISSFLRTVSGIPSPFTYEAPATKDFFEKVDKVEGTEMEKVTAIYQLTTEAVPNYGTPGSDNLDLSKMSTFEETLSCQKGICRDQAALLNAALKKQGIDSEVVAGDVDAPGDHVWVRVKTTTGYEFDLDPTWYKDFVTLGLRAPDQNQVQCNKLAHKSFKDPDIVKFTEYKISGNGQAGGKSIRLQIDNLTNDFLNIKIPLGLILYSDNPSKQNMVVAREENVCLSPGDPVIILYANCVNSQKGTPRSDTTFSVGPMASADLMQVLKENDLDGSYNGGKVWNVTNKLNIDPWRNKITVWYKKFTRESIDFLENGFKKIKMITITLVVLDVILYLIYEQFILRREKAILWRIFIFLKYLFNKVRSLFKKHQI